VEPHEDGTARLAEAVTAYRAALEEWTPERVPRSHEFTQRNLARTLAELQRRKK